MSGDFQAVTNLAEWQLNSITSEKNIHKKKQNIQMHKKITVAHSQKKTDSTRYRTEQL